MASWHLVDPDGRVRSAGAALPQLLEATAGAGGLSPSRPSASATAATAGWPDAGLLRQAGHGRRQAAGRRADRRAALNDEGPAGEAFASSRSSAAQPTAASTAPRLPLARERDSRAGSVRARSRSRPPTRRDPRVPRCRRLRSDCDRRGSGRRCRRGRRARGAGTPWGRRSGREPRGCGRCESSPPGGEAREPLVVLEGQVIALGDQSLARLLQPVRRTLHRGRRGRLVMTEQRGTAEGCASAFRTRSGPRRARATRSRNRIRRS